MSGTHEIPTRSEIRDGMRIDWHLGIPMDDGIVLRADVYRPIAGGRYPVILSHGVYAKGLAYQDGYPMQWQKMVADHPEILEGSSNKYQAWEVTDPERWIPHGYVVMRVDSRGSGWSPGYLDPLCPREDDDLYQCLEWAATQAWSTGKVGMLGISYYAINQWRVAAKRPAHLTAIIPWEGFGRKFVYGTRGTGGMTHDDPINRPREVFGGRVTLHAGPDRPSYLLLPIVPPKR